MIHIFAPGPNREIIVDALKAMDIDFTEDPIIASVSVGKLKAISKGFNYTYLRALLENGESFRQIAQKMSIPMGTIWRYMRKSELSEIPEQDREFFSEYRCLVDARKEIEKLIRGVGNEFGQRRMHRLLDRDSQVSASDSL